MSVDPMTINPASVGPAPDGEGWIEWSGGENPVPGQRVDVMTLGTGLWANWLSDQWGVSWLREDEDDADNIIAYRIAPHPDREAEPTGGVEVPRELVAFLLGEGSYGGVEFGEPVMSPTGRPQPYWWRHALREALSVSPPVVEGALRASPFVPTALDHPAVANLRENQQQLDPDGVMVGVSRQALDEVLALFTAPTVGQDVVRDAEQ